MQTSRIAVVGGGIAGLSAAWVLSARHDVTLFEADGRVGGHSNTVDVPGPGNSPLGVDTGFIVYNERNYPGFSAMLSHLGVDTQESDMSFAYSSARTGLEWAGDSLGTLFAQRSNLFRPAFWRMLADILRFNRRSRQALDELPEDERSLGEFLAAMDAGRELTEHYLLPMAAAIWSCPRQEMLATPAHRLLRFFDNHGLIDLFNRPRWRTVTGGSRQYIKRMLPGISGSHVTGTPIRRLAPHREGVRLYGDAGELGTFDQVVVAAHADQALAMLENPGFWQSTLLSAFDYQANDAWLHTDTGHMPVRRTIWASWNYMDGPPEAAPAITYWMNRLQRLPGPVDYLVSLNPQTPPDPASVLGRFHYRHPIFNQAASRAQGMLQHLQGRNRIWFCGSYFGHGFHEDALNSSLDVCRRMGVLPPWARPRAAQAWPEPVEQLPRTDLQVS